MARSTALMSTADIARLLVVSESTVRRWAQRDGTICGVPVVRLGLTNRARYVVPRARLLAALGIDAHQPSEK